MKYVEVTWWQIAAFFYNVIQEKSDWHLLIKTMFYQLGSLLSRAGNFLMGVFRINPKPVLLLAYDG